VNEAIAQIYELARAVWRRRWLALATAWSVALAIWAVVLVLPDRYEASARVFVDARTALRPVLEGIAIQEDYESQLSLVREALLSRPQLATVARKTNLDAGVKTASQMDALISNLQKQIQVTSVATDTQRSQLSDTIYTITYQNQNRDKSVEVVKTLLENFEQGTLSGNRSGSDQAQVFLNQQIAALEKRLQESEERLAEFKKRNVGMIPGERGDYFARMDKEMAGLQQAETSLAVALSRRSELQHQVATSRAYIPGTAALNNSVAMAGAPPDVTLRRQEAEQKLEELLQRYTDKHPEVIAVRRNLEELKVRETAELAELQKGGMGTGAIRSLSANPVYQQIQSQLNQTQVEIASLQGEVNQHRSEIANLRRFVDQAPEIEQEFSRLNRDYTVTKEQYNQLVTRREQARVSDDAARTGIVRFNTIEPPRAANDPTWPKRPLLIVAGLFAAIGAGLALALLPYYFAPTFGGTSALERTIGLPVIGSVSAIKTEQVRKRERGDARRVAFALLVLVALAGVLAAVGPIGLRLLHNLVT
jgi:polysaccharide chain length determinant protein (PEP-CTERM system associated)